MSEPGTRPGGLTALAIINFLVAAWSLLGAASVFLGPALVSAGLKHAEAQAAERAERDRRAETRGEATRPTEEVRKEAEGLENMRKAERLFEEHPSFFMLVGGGRVVLGLLLLLSAIGYLKVRRGLGRMVGSVYALAAIAWGIWVIKAASTIPEHSFGLFDLIGFLYPAATLFALHFIFKDDFVNP